MSTTQRRASTVPLNLEPGDVLVTRSDTWLSKAIRFFEKLQTKDARVSHAAIAIGDDQCIESLWRVKINDLAKYRTDGQVVFIYRLPLTLDQRAKLRRGILTNAGGNYGWTKLPLFALDGIASAVTRAFGRKKPVFFFTRRLGLLNIPVCSQFVVYALEKWAGFTLKDAASKTVPWREVSPDYLDDLLQMPENGATEVIAATRTAVAKGTTRKPPTVPI